MARPWFLAAKRFSVLLLDPRAVHTQIHVVLDWFTQPEAKVPRAERGLRGSAIARPSRRLPEQEVGAL